MFDPLFAADWGDFLRILPFIIAVLFWVISQFGAEIGKQAKKNRPVRKPAEPAADRPDLSLQEEIDEFVREVRQSREGRPALEDRPAAGQAPQETPRRSRPPRRVSGSSRRSTQRRSPPQPTVPPPLPGTVVVAEVRESAGPTSLDRPRAQPLSNAQFLSGLDQHSQFQAASDADFQSHMQRVFDHDLGSLKPANPSVFGTATATASANDAKGLSVDARQPIRQSANDIAAYLASRSNVRDAVVLSEILERPEHRW